jgi:hypothetical protein
MNTEEKKKPEEERDQFEEWFMFTFGGRPEGNQEQLREEAAELLAQANQIEIWEAEHRAALAAWAEKHGRSNGGRR